MINTAFEHNEGAEKYRCRLEKLALLPNVELVDVKTEGEAQWELLKLPAVLRKLNVDLLHMPANRVCLTTFTPQVATFHDAMELKFLNEIYHMDNAKSLKEKFYVLKHKFYAWLIYRIGVLRVKDLITISNFSKRSLVSELGAMCGKAKVIYHGIPEDFKPIQNALELMARKGVLMLGGDGYQKNPTNAIKAWAMLPNDLKKQHPLRIMGFSGNEDSPIVKTIRELQLENDIELKSWVSQEELVEAFQESAALLFVSREEGFGFPLVQAMACGTPAVISQAEALLELSGDAALSAPAESAGEISKQLQQIVSNSDVWQELSENSLERAKEFTWDIFANKTVNVYLNALN